MGKECAELITVIAWVLEEIGAKELPFKQQV